MGRTDCTEPQCLYKGALYLTYDEQIGCRQLVCVCLSVYIAVQLCSQEQEPCRTYSQCLFYVTVNSHRPCSHVTQSVQLCHGP